MNNENKRELTAPKTDKESLDRSKLAQRQIKEYIQETSLGYSKSFSQKAGSEVYIKFENQQTTGSFKVRGAVNKLISLSDKEKLTGVIASSAGNHSQGVAYSAAKLGINSHVVMPETAPLIKVVATKGYGANVVLHGQVYEDAFEKTKELIKEQGYIFVPPYEDDLVIAGQSTVALEIFDRIQDFDSIVVPIGGGGLISGIAMVAKALNPKCKIYGVQVESVPSMYNLFYDYKDQPRKFTQTIADGIAVKSTSKKMFDEYISRFVDEIVVVSENEIAAAMVMLLERKKAVVEGAGAASIAAIFSGKLKLGKKTCAILSGGNTDLNTISKVIQVGLMQTGRLALVSVVVDDKPGTLSKITEVIGLHKANILEVEHNRMLHGLELRHTRIDFYLETIDAKHIESIMESLLTIEGCQIEKNLFF